MITVNVQGKTHKVEIVNVYTNHVTGRQLTMVEAVEGKPFIIAASKHCLPQYSQYAFVSIDDIIQEDTIEKEERLR